MKHVLSSYNFGDEFIIYYWDDEKDCVYRNVLPLMELKT